MFSGISRGSCFKSNGISRGGIFEVEYLGGTNLKSNGISRGSMFKVSWNIKGGACLMSIEISRGVNV